MPFSRAGCDRGFFNPAHVSAYDINTVRLAEVAAETGITAAVSTAEAARQADMVLLAVKPNVVESVVAEMGDALCGKAVLSIASGWTTEKLRALLPESARVMFVIPNTPCMVGEGMAIAEEGSTFTQEEQEYVRELFSAIGQYRVVPQKLMNGASTLTGCGPAFIYLIMEGLADGAVYHGVPRQLAYELAAQTVIGAGKDAAGKRPAPRCAQGQCLLARRHYHPRHPCYGGRRCPCCDDRRHRRRQPQRLSLSVQNRLFHWDSRFFLSPARPLFSTGRPAKCGKVCTLRLFTRPALPIIVPAGSTGFSWSGLPDPLPSDAPLQGRAAPGKPPHRKIPGTHSGMPGIFYPFTAAVPGVTSARRSHGLPL